ncbi:MAG: hypothetical protein OXF07_08275, partial [Rhodobacter sp.]|nr:hypothetical protein [Rhodobacter sp.]
AQVKSRSFPARHRHLWAAGSPRDMVGADGSEPGFQPGSGYVPPGDPMAALSGRARPVSLVSYLTPGNGKPGRGHRA